MLTAADADLARRDRRIPGLATVLDPDALVTALRRVAPALELQAAQIRFVRYKPHEYCRVVYCLHVAAGTLDLAVRACRRSDLATWSEHAARPNGSAWDSPRRITLRECAVVGAVFPSDLKLQSLPDLVHDADRPRTLRALLPDHPALWQGELRGLRYRPERRFVAELRAGDGTRALVKSYTRKAYGGAKRNAQAFQSGGPLRIARLLGFEDDSRMLAFEWLPGRVLVDHYATPPDHGAVTATGGALAMLHAQHPAGLNRWTRQHEAADLVSVGAEVGFIAPRLARLVDLLARHLVTRLRAAPARRDAVHGDFSANQVLVEPSGVGIIDLDWACYGDAADDLGNFIAQAERFALRGELSPSQVERIRAALLEGYVQVTAGALPPGIGLYTAVQVFRRARFPFRAREPDWPERTAALLERAAELVARLP